MQRISFSLIAIFLTSTLFAQTEKYKIAIDNFQTNYNAEKYDEIFNSFSPDMKQAIIKPYKELKETENKTVNALNYPEEIAEIIYSLA